MISQNKPFIGILLFVTLIPLVLAQTESESIIIESFSIDEITTSSSLIMVTTNLETRLTLMYGTLFEAYDNELAFTDYTDTHEITLEDLTPGTEYYFTLTLCSDALTCTTPAPYSFVTSEPVEEESIDELGETLSVDVPSETTKKIASAKHMGAPVVTLSGLYQHYKVKQPKKLFVLSSETKKVHTHIVELLEINKKNVLFRIDGFEFILEEEQKISADLDNDGIYDLNMKLLFVGPNNARILFTSTNKVVQQSGIAFESDLFEIPEEYLKETIDDLENVEQPEEYTKTPTKTRAYLLSLLAISIVVAFFLLKKHKKK